MPRPPAAGQFIVAPDDPEHRLNQLPQFAKATFHTNLGVLGSSEITRSLVNGQATASLTSTASGTATIAIQAKDAEENPITRAVDGTIVQFRPAAPASIVLVVDPLSIVADGGPTSTITAPV